MFELLKSICLVTLPVIWSLFFFFLAYQSFKEKERTLGIFGAVAALIFLIAAVAIAYYFFAPAELPFRPIIPHTGPTY